MTVHVTRRSVVATLGAFGVLSGRTASAQRGLEQYAFAAWLYVLLLIEMAGARPAVGVGAERTRGALQHGRACACPPRRSSWCTCP